MSQKKTEKTTNSLSDKVAAVKAAREVMAEQERDVPYKARQGWAIRRRAAEDSLPGLLLDVTSAVIPKRVVAVFLQVEDLAAQDLAAKIVADNGGLVFDAAKTWVDVVNAVEPGMGPSRGWSVNAHHLAVSVIANAARDLGMESMDRPAYFEISDNSYAGLIAAARRLAEESDLRDLVMRRFKHEITEDVVVGDLTVKPVPVLVVNASPEETLMLSACASKKTTLMPDEKQIGLILAGEGATILHEAFKQAA